MAEKTIRHPRLDVDGRRVARIYSLSLDEAISAPTRLDVRFPDPDREFTGADLIGKAATLTIVSDGGDEERFQGIVAGASLEMSLEAGVVHRLDVVDTFSNCTNYKRFRTFENRGLDDIVRSILGTVDVKVALDLKASPQFPFRVQYGESDLAFVSRILAENGVYYYQVDGVLQLRDDSTASSGSALTVDREYLDAFDLRQEIRPLEGRGVSYLYESEENVVADAPAIQGEFPGGAASKDVDGGRVDLVFEGPSDRDRMNRLTTVRSEAQAAKTTVGSGTIRIPTIRPGRTIELTGLGRSEFDGRYFVTKAKHEYRTSEPGKTVEQEYHNSFTCIPSSTKYRPVSRYPAPSAPGVQVGQVVAPASAESSDGANLGRVRVKIPWMEQDGLCQGFSCWARVLEAHAGSDHGTVFIPELCDEVLVAFEGGNPDYPVVLGSLYTGKRPPLVPIPPDHKNQQKLILTRSGNAILFEDLEDTSRLSIYQKDDCNAVVLEKGTEALIEVSSIGTIRILGKGDGEIYAEQGAGHIRIDKEGNILVETGKSIHIKGTGSGEIVLSQGQGKITIDASGNIEIRGPKVAIKGDATIAQQAGAEMTLKAAMIRIN